MGLYSFVVAGPLFIIPKLFIYFCGLSHPFLGSGAGWVKAAGWRSCAGHPTHFRLTQQSQACDLPLLAPPPSSSGTRGIEHRQSGWQRCVHQSRKGSSHPPAQSPALGTCSYRWRKLYPCDIRHPGGLTMCNDTENHTLPHPTVTNLSYPPGHPNGCIHCLCL